MRQRLGLVGLDLLGLALLGGGGGVGGPSLGHGGPDAEAEGLAEGRRHRVTHLNRQVRQVHSCHI